jgi:hypothetical protein
MGAAWSDLLPLHVRPVVLLLFEPADSANTERLLLLRPVRVVAGERSGTGQKVVRGGRKRAAVSCLELLAGGDEGHGLADFVARFSRENADEFLANFSRVFGG